VVGLDAGVEQDDAEADRDERAGRADEHGERRRDHGERAEVDAGGRDPRRAAADDSPRCSRRCRAAPSPLGDVPECAEHREAISSVQAQPAFLAGKPIDKGGRPLVDSP